MKSITNSLHETRRALDEGAAENLQRLGDPRARRIDASLTSSRIGSQGLLRTNVELVRPSNPLQEKVYVNQVTALEYRNVHTEFLEALQFVTTSANSSQESRLVRSVDDFFQQAKNLESTNSPAMRQAFIDKGESVARTLTDASAKINNLRLEADSRLQQDVSSVNNTIKSIVAVNRSILSSQVPVKLMDQRDSLIKDLAAAFDINVRYFTNGSVEISSASSGERLVDRGVSYAQFEYHSASRVESVLSGEYSNIKIRQFDDRGRIISNSDFMGETGNNVKRFSGGKWDGLVEIRDRIMPEVATAIEALATNFTKKINDLHNNGSPFPPKTWLKSALSVSGTQSMNWGEKFTIYAVNKEGDQLAGGAGKINPVEIDMANARTAQASGNATVWDLVDEINERLDLAPSRERAALGQIKDENGAPLPNERLLNNLQLKAHGPVDVANGNSLTFGLDFQGNSHFGSNIEVLAVETGNQLPGAVGYPGAQQVGVAGQTYRLEKDENKEGATPITVGNVTAGRYIILDVRITGDNGQVSRGKVSFPLPANPVADIAVNNRMSFENVANATTGDFEVNLQSHSGVGRAKLVDETGIEIAHGSSQQGNLVIETSSDEYRIVLQGEGSGDDNFASKFGFNNLFNYDAESGKVNISEHIAADISQIAIGRVSKSDGTKVVHEVGDAQSNMTLAFAGANLAAGVNQITISAPANLLLAPIAFNFIAAPGPGGYNDVVVDAGGNNAATIANLMAKINNHPELGPLVEALPSGADIILRSKTPGDNGNLFGVVTNLAAGTVNFTPGVIPGAAPAIAIVGGTALAPVPAVTQLGGGTDIPKESDVFSYNIRSGSKEVLEDVANLQTNLVEIEALGIVPNVSASLSGIATLVSGMISDYVNEANIESDIAAEVLKQTDDYIKNNFGIDRNEEYLKVLDMAQLLSALANVFSTMHNAQTKVQDIIFR